MTGQMLLRFKSRYDKWLWPVLIAVPLLPLVRAGFLVAADEFQSAWVMLVVTGLVLLVLWSMLPRAFELWPDSVRIVLGWQWGINIPLNTIAEVLPGKGVAPWIGLRAMFATSFKKTVQLRRTKGMAFLLSPDNPEKFIEDVQHAQANPGVR